MEFPRRRFVHLITGAAALPVVPPAAALGQGTISPTSATMIAHNTSPSPVWPPTCSIYDARLAPCALSIGLPAGEIFVSIRVVMAASQMSRGSAPSAMQPHAKRTLQRAQHVRHSRAFGCR